jgi:hypothetical protein
MGYFKQRALRLLKDEGGFWNLLIPAAASLISGMMAGRNGKKNAQQAAGGATFQNLMPQIQQMIAHSQQVSQQNYTNQQQRQTANQPLQDLVRQMAMRIGQR